MIEIENIKKLHAADKLFGVVFLWGIGKKTKAIIESFQTQFPQINLAGIVDNYKSDFMDEYSGCPVYPVDKLNEYDLDDVCVLLAVATSDGIWKQLNAMDIGRVYNLSNIDEICSVKECTFPYTFVDRNNGKEKCVYVLAGYQEELWETTLHRMFRFMEPEIDYCMISSGKYDERLDELCEKYGWSYLYSDHNQICYLQNLVIDKHPKARLFIKLDEDMFIGRGFYSRMFDGYERANDTGEYRVGAVVPIMPLNYNSYVSYLRAIGKLQDFEKKYGRAYRCTFSAPYSLEDAAVWIWDTVDSIDAMSERFFKSNAAPVPLSSLYNIGAFLYTRKRWLMFGKWPEDPNNSGMGVDESYLFHENMDSGMATYELQNVFVGHFAFSGQKEKMFEYYKKNHAKFEIEE